MQRLSLILICLLSVLNSYGISRQEFISLINEERGDLSMTGYGALDAVDQKVTFYANGTGVWQFSESLSGVTAHLRSLSGMMNGQSRGVVNMELSCDGAEAGCYFDISDKFKWAVDSKGNLRVTYTNVISNEARIVQWNTLFTSENVRCVNSQLNRLKKYATNLVGKTEVYTFSLSDSMLKIHGANKDFSTYIIKREPVVTAAEYPGGSSEIESYVLKNQVYPASLRQEGYKESIDFTLEIDPQGNVASVQCYTNNELTQYTVRLLKNLPYKFTPATRDGVTFSSTFDVKIQYHTRQAIRLDDDKVHFDYKGGKDEIRVNSVDGDWNVSVPAGSFFSAKRDYTHVVITCPERKYNETEARSGKFYVQTADGANKYVIKVTQKGAPKAYIKLSETSVVLSHSKKSARAIVNVSSNREWTITNHSPESKIDAKKNGNQITFTSQTDRKKYGEDATFTIESVNKDCQANIHVHQNSKQEDKESSNSKSYKSSGIGLWEDYYDNYGSFELGLVDLQVGAGCTMPLFSVENGEKVLTTEPYFPLNFEVCYLRFHFVELSLLNFRLDLSTDGKEGFAWEPQIRGLIPVSERWALMPYVGPVCQINPDGKEKSVWSASGGLMARVRYGKVTHTNFSIGYKGGPCGGLAIGVSIGWSLGW